MHNLSRLTIGALTAILALPVMSSSNVIVDGTPAGNVTIESFSFDADSNTLTIVTDQGGQVIGPENDDGGNTGGGGDGPVSIDSFTVTRTDPPVGTSITFTYQTTNAVSCEYRGGIGPWRSGPAPSLPNGQKTVQITNDVSRNFRLICNGSETGDSVEENIIVTGVEVDDTPQQTEACRDKNIPRTGGVTTGWEESNAFGQPFPSNTFNVQMTVPERTYKAIDFNTGSIAGRGTYTLANSNSVQWNLAAISPCEGDFDVVDNCRAVLGIDGLSWITELSSQSDSGRCVLDPDTTYYLNLAWGEFDFSVPENPGATCVGSCPNMEILHGYTED